MIPLLIYTAFILFVGSMLGFAIGRAFESDKHFIQDVSYRVNSMGHND